MEVEGCGIPLELSELKTVEEANEAYEKLLLEYIEHQNVLDQIISSKLERIKTLKEELEQAGWIPPKHFRERLLTKHSLSEPSQRPSLSRNMSRTFKKLKPSRSSRLMEQTAIFPDGPTISENVYSNQDIINRKRQSTTSEGSVTPEDFMVVSIIGQGAFGKVFLVVKKATGQLMAMKVMQKESILEDGDDSIRHVVHELEFMRDMSHHPFIVCKFYYNYFYYYSNINLFIYFILFYNI